MSKNKLLVMALISASAFTGMAHAEGFFAGAELGSIKATDFCNGLSGTGASCDDSDTTYRIFGGYNANENISFELGYRDLGNFSIFVTNGVDSLKENFEAKALDMDIVGHLPLSKTISAYGKFGMEYWDAKDSASGVLSSVAFSGSESKSGFDPLWGVGVEWNLDAVTLTGSFEHLFHIGDDNSVTQVNPNIVSVGMRYNLK